MNPDHNRYMADKTLLNQTGQVALLVLLVLTIALTIGLSIVSRTVSEIRIAADTERSTQAYAAAEAGIEQALTGNAPAPGSEVPLQLGDGKSAKFSVSTPANSGTSSAGDFGFPSPVEKDEAVQLWLFNYKNFIATSSTITDLFPGTNGNHSMDIYWGTPSKITSSSDVTQVPALEVTLLYAEVTGNNLSNFGIEKYAFDALAGSRNNNFNSTDVDTDPATTLTLTNMNNQVKQYKYRSTITLTNMGTNNKRYLLMRVKPLYANLAHDIGVRPNPQGTTALLPPQGDVVESQGTSGNVVRRLKVYQSYPTLPGIFDFVLFNASSNSLSK